MFSIVGSVIMLLVFVVVPIVCLNWVVKVLLLRVWVQARLSGLVLLGCVVRLIYVMSVVSPLLLGVAAWVRPLVTRLVGKLPSR